MLNANLEMFFKNIGDGGEFADKILKANDKEVVQKLAREVGIEMTLEEIEEAKTILIRGMEAKLKY
jgi:hypothetical protein